MGLVNKSGDGQAKREMARRERVSVNGEGVAVGVDMTVGLVAVVGGDIPVGADLIAGKTLYVTGVAFLVVSVVVTVW